jgi:hypothetical protein
MHKREDPARIIAEEATMPTNIKWEMRNWSG